MTEILRRFKNKLKKYAGKIGAWLIVKSSKSEMAYFGWKRLRWYEDVNGMWLVYYVCKDFPKSDEMPLGDNCVKINGRGGPRCGANQEANQSSRHQGTRKDEDIQPDEHQSQDESRVRHDRIVQDQCHEIFRARIHIAVQVNVSVDRHVFNLQPLTIENLRNRMKRFDIHDIEYRPKRMLFPHHVRKALAKAFADAVTGATAITLLIAGSMI